MAYGDTWKGYVIHGTEACNGSHCCFHGPSDHRMVKWKMLIRESLLVERLCPKHGVGHPDPDSLAWFERNGVRDMGIHACCGCCHD